MGQVLAEALAAYEVKRFPQARGKVKQKGKQQGDRAALEHALRDLDDRQSRCYDLWEHRVIKDAGVLQARLESTSP